MPFIPLLKQSTHILNIDSSVDYRNNGSEEDNVNNTFLSPATPENR